MIGPALRVAAGVLLLGISAGAAHSWLVPVTLRLEQNSAPATPAAGASGPVGDAVEPRTQPAAPETASEPLGVHITLAQAKELFDRGVVFLDAREEHELGEGVVAGALHLTSTMVSTGAAGDVLSLLDPAQPAVIYCGGGSCDASENLAILLRQGGFATLHIMHDGFPAWQAAGHPVDPAPGNAP